MKKVILAALVLISILAVAAYAQQPKASAPAGHDHHMMAGHGDAEKGEHHWNMMADHKEMMTRMDGMDAKLDSLVDSMNKANGDARVDAMTAVINELVSQRKQMRSEMMNMQGSMTGCCMKDGKMQHAAEGGKGHSMEGCPMHKETK